MNKSQKGYNFQRRVLKHLKEQGFNCVVQKSFPDIIAWKPFMDSNGMSPVLHTQMMMGNKVSHNTFIPFFVTLVECKKLTKKTKKEAEKVLKENRCNIFLVAYLNKKKLEFQEIKSKKGIKIVKKEIPSYLR